MKAAGIVFSNIHDKEIKELTTHRTLASVPFGGRYRLIDFVLSNMSNSGISDIGVITKSNYQSLMEHVGSGKHWDLSRTKGGLVILPPFGKGGSKLYSTRFEAIKDAAYYIKDRVEPYIIMSDCDNVCSIDYTTILEYHIKKNADITVVYRENTIPEGDSKRRIKLSLNDDGRVENTTISNNLNGTINEFVNIFVFTKSFLINIIDKAQELEIKSFSRDVLKRCAAAGKLYGYKFTENFAVIDSMANYYKNSMKLLDKGYRDSLFRVNGNNIYTRVENSPPTIIKEGSNVKNSIIADGCIIEGEVINSILFRDVKVEKGVRIENSILFRNNQICKNSHLNCVISDQNVTVLDGRQLSGHSSRPYFIEKGVTI